MGNKVPGMPEMPMADIQACAEEVMTTFVPIYTKSYAIGLVDKLKAEADAAAATPDSDPPQLRTPPIADEWLKEGWLTKLGAVKKNWKKRWFVATNAADNYRIMYFEKEELKEDPKKKKGEIQPCGYRIKHLNKEEEQKEFGEFCLTFKPYGRRRQWFVKCANADDLKEWEGVFKFSAKQAGPPLNPDQVMTFAYKRAYEMTRWQLGVWGWYWYDRTEEEQLGQLIVDRCEEGCMRPVYDSIPGGRLQRKIRAAVQDTLDKTVGAAVGASWKVAVSGIESQKETLESKAREALGPILEKMSELKATVKDKIVGIISPALEEITKPIMTPICNCLMAPLVAAHKALALSYHARMSSIIEEGDIEGGLNDFVRQIRWWWGPMRPALVQIYKAFREGWEDDEPETAGVSFSVSVNIGDIVDLLQGVSAWQIEDQFEDNLRTLMAKSIYTFSDELKNKKDAGEESPDLGAIRDQVTRMLMHDSRLNVRAAIREIFLLVIQPPFKRKVDPLIKDILEPITSAIPDALKTFLDIQKMAIEVMDGILEDTITNCIRPASEPVLAMLDSLPADLSLSD